MQRKILIKNGRVVNADISEIRDIIIVGEVIEKIGTNLSPDSDTEVIDATGKFVFPGGIDPHTHLEFEFMGGTSVDDFYSGTRAAVAGGTTTIIDFAIPKKGESLLDTYNSYKRKADEKVVCDYALHMGVTSWDETVKQCMQYLVEKCGINSFKVFMAYKNMMMLDDADIYQAFLHCKKLGAVPMVHAENGHVIVENAKRLLANGVTGPEGHALSRPECVEAEATNRACMIAENVDSPLYVVHVMSDSAAQMIGTRRKRDFCRIFGETLAAGLGTTAPETDDFRVQAAHVMSPPIRSDKTTPNTLMRHLADDVLSTTGSDNCTFNIDQKSIGKNDFTKIPNGVNGVEDRLSVVWEMGVHSGLITPERFVEITSTNSAKIFNIYPKKGCIRVGSDADVVIWDPNKVRTISATTHHHACDFNIFEGMVVHGVPDVVLVRGKVSFKDGTICTKKGWGKFVPTPPFPPLLYSHKRSNLTLV
ncbi:dihydropyrimidinase-like [Cimex lectularius]|uniref:dihydropyrimidinase n=1 Tax=Cimex lectularius TaxID=79782 RepID=A0A8I6S8Q3_CIMLE|nr:dihydropyrimidinase-like [Cimex lectularius]